MHRSSYEVYINVKRARRETFKNQISRFEFLCVRRNQFRISRATSFIRNSPLIYLLITKFVYYFNKTKKNIIK